MKHFINWKKRYQDLYRRHEKLAATMTLNLSIAQDKINDHVEQGRALLLANEALQSEVQDLLAKLEYTTNDLAEALEKLDTCRDVFVKQIKVTDYYRHLAKSYQLAQELGYTRKEEVCQGD